jgi:hypothetical protein
MKRIIKLTNSLFAIFALLVCLQINSSFIYKGQNVPKATVKKNTQIITIKNDTDFRVDRIFLSPCEADDWGDDILDEDEVLEPGESVQVEITCGKWDVKLMAVDSSTCEINAVNICAASIWLIQADC